VGFSRLAGRSPLPDLKGPAAAVRSAFERGAEVGDGAVEAFVEFHLRLPAERAACDRDVWSSLRRIVLWQGAVYELRLAPDLGERLFGQFADGEFVGVAQVDRAVNVGAGFHE